jgi:glycosyltransferase involved in cell wall biosynthesis
MSLLEAMALAKPVVAAGVGGVPDQVVDGETGFVTAPGDQAGLTRSLLALASDPARAEEMGRAGQARQRRHFTGEGMVDGYALALEEAVTRGQA